MVNKETVIVVGAGASKEFNLPTGDELKNEIINLLKPRKGFYGVNNEIIMYSIRSYARNNSIPDLESKLIESASRIVEALPLSLSIDNLIDTHRGDKEIEVCGKLAIVKSILESERQSSIYIDPRSHDKIDFENLDNNWLISLFKLITENCVFDDLPDRLSKIRLIIFNYDRCVEHFLYHAFQRYYGAGRIEVKKLFESLKIYHPYGTVGTLPWMELDNQIYFGDQPNGKQVASLIEGLRTFTEGVNPEEGNINKIRRAFNSANRIIFLGFAYLDLNMQLLCPSSKAGSNSHLKHCYGTSFGISDANTESIKLHLKKIITNRENNIKIRNDLTCTKLFNEYSRLLSFSNV